MEKKVATSEGKKKTSRYAIFSIIFGFLGYIGFGPFMAIPAIVCGHISRHKIKRKKQQFTGKRLAFWGLLLGYVNVTLFAVIVSMFFKMFYQDVDVVTGASVSYSLIHGKRMYDFKCASCHGAGGEGISPVPSLVGSQWVVGPEEHVIKIVMNGFKSTSQIESEHPAFVNELLDRDISSIITYIRRSWGNDASPIRQATISQWRTKIGNRNHPWTRDDFLNPLSEYNRSQD